MKYIIYTKNSDLDSGFQLYFDYQGNSSFNSLEKAKSFVEDLNKNRDVIFDLVIF